MSLPTANTKKDGPLKTGCPPLDYGKPPLVLLEENGAGVGGRPLSEQHLRILEAQRQREREINFMGKHGGHHHVLVRQADDYDAIDLRPPQCMPAERLEL